MHVFHVLVHIADVGRCKTSLISAACSSSLLVSLVTSRVLCHTQEDTATSRISLSVSLCVKA